MACILGAKQLATFERELSKQACNMGFLSTWIFNHSRTMINSVPFFERVFAVLGFAALQMACGDAHAAYRGAVVQAPSPGHVFAARKNSEKLPPLEGVKVQLVVGGKPGLCERYRVEKFSPRSQATTGADGYYDVSQFFGLSPGKTTVVVCFWQDHFDTYEYYNSDWGSNKEPTFGQKYLNVRMRKTK